MTEAGDRSEPRQYAPDFLTELFRNPLDPGYADAAARRARDGDPTGWPRRITTTVSALTLVALGLLFVVAYRQTVADEPARTQARNALIEQVQKRRAGTDQLQQRADALRGEVAALRERELGGPAVARLRNLEAATGLAPVRGDGARITLGDGATPIDPVTGRRTVDGRVRDSDLQLAANALWAAGAEAIAVNGQRLTATSTIRQAGEAILVDFRPVTTPYMMVAIGPDDLAETFRAPAVPGPRLAFRDVVRRRPGTQCHHPGGDRGDSALRRHPGTVRRSTLAFGRFVRRLPVRRRLGRRLRGRPVRGRRVHRCGGVRQPAQHPLGRRLMIAVLALLAGVLLGVVLDPTVPAALQPYLPIAVVAALDAVFGGVRAKLDGIFDDKQFVISFISNVLVAAMIVYLGDQLGVGGQLSTGVVVVLGVRIFGNVAAIRRHLFRA
jgi:small basic protein/uncharacterized protein YlxW (UPF0749 family)